jgi:predicted DNA-binding transcriptional regulator YafY
MRADRLLALLFRLRTQERVTAKCLACELEVSERTIYRDIDALCVAGVPIISEFGPGGGFSLPDNYRHHLNGLSQSETRAIIRAVHAHPFLEREDHLALASAIQKLSAVLPTVDRQEQDDARQRIYIDTSEWEQLGGGGSQLGLLHEATRRNKIISFSYNIAQGVLTFGWMAPYGLVLKAGVWYVVGAVNDTTTVWQVRQFQTAGITDEIFDRPADFNLNEYWTQWLQRRGKQGSQTTPRLYLATVD